jgi:hypothetical protein
VNAKRALIGGLFLAIVLLMVYRQRFFVRDPLARVERNGMQQAGYRVYINYFNDLLVEVPTYNLRYLVQAKHGVPMVPGVPLHLRCLRGLACLTEVDYAPTLPLAGRGYTPMVVMTNAYVTFLDGEGASMRVALR